MKAAKTKHYTTVMLPNGGHLHIHRAIMPTRVPGRRIKANKCRKCGFKISKESEYCGECLCEEDEL